MSEWTPKGNEFVMVSERGPLRAIPQGPWGARCALFDDGTSAYVGEVPTAWLTPAPEPEPDEPTAPGALVRDKRGNLWVKHENPAGPYVDPKRQERERGWGDWVWIGGPGAFASTHLKWSELASTATVVLPDPAEVEQLRERADQLEQLVVDMDTKHDELVTERDELRRRIDRYVGRRVLRGES